MVSSLEDTQLAAVDKTKQVLFTMNQLYAVIGEHAIRNVNSIIMIIKLQSVHVHPLPLFFLSLKDYFTHHSRSSEARRMS